MRNETVDALRAAAAISVCFFHFVSGNTHFAEASILRPAANYGWLGIQVFFVISGFIVPFAMSKACYQLQSWPRFMARRLIRLEPPYLASIAITLLLAVASTYAPGFRGVPLEISLAQIASHIGYLNAFIGWPWLNPVYWTLALEFQFYALIGLMLPAFTAGTPATRLALLGVVAASPVLIPVTGQWLITEYLHIFAAGLLTFLAVTGRVQKSAYWAALAILAAFIALREGMVVAAAATLTAAMIATIQLPRIAGVAWVGAISYSLYLLHVPIGGRIVNLSTRLQPSAALEIVVVAMAFATSIAAAYLLYRFVEKPAVEAASSVALAPSSHAAIVQARGRTSA